MHERIRSVAVFCGSRGGSDPAYLEAARRVGAGLADRGLRLVYGGGGVGMMGALADACLEAGGDVAGVIPVFLMEKELGHTGIQQLEIVDTMLERKTRMAELSDASITLPGGIGTMDELFEMLTWGRLHIHDQPVGLLNVRGYYDELVSFLHVTQVDGGFVSREHARDLLVSEDLDDLLEQLEHWRPKP